LGQEGPGSGARTFHHDQYAPLALAGSSGLPRGYGPAGRSAAGWS
jgi:hypothetical protein